MLEARGSFEPYPYILQQEVDLGRYVVERGALSTMRGMTPYAIVRMRPFVCVLPVVDAGTRHARCVLVRQFRYAVQDWQLEPPAGGIEDGEAPQAAALRELREESGLVVEDMRDLGRVYPSAGSTSEVAHLFAARCSGLRVSRDLDLGEQIETVAASRAQMEELLLSGSYAHAVTYAAWMRFAASGLLDEWMPA